MRYFEILTESYTDDTGSEQISNTKINDYVDPSQFEKEDKQLRNEYKIKSKDAINTIKHYSDESTINQLLIDANGDSEKLSPNYLKQYDLLMGLSGSLQEEHHVYCGSGDYGPKDDFETICFLSASLNIEVAVKSTNFRRDEGDHDNILHFILPKGFSGGFYIAEYSKNPEELEFLIFPHQKFEYIKTKTIHLNGLERSIHSFKPYQNAR